MMRFQPLVCLVLAAYNICAAAAAFVHQVDAKKVCCKHQQSSLQLHDAVTPLSELETTCYDSLLNEIPSSAQIVLIGEGTHGTEQFFRIRSELTKHLIQRRGFDAVICEGDVQPFFQLSKLSPRDNIRKSLSDIFEPHFPDWMWNNVPMAEFVSWMHTRSKHQQLMGMDIQSPFASMDFITEQLDEMDDKNLVTLTNECYATLNSFRPNIRRYGDAVYANRVPSQASAVQKVVDALSEMYTDIHDNKTFELLHNAYAVVASEAYHRQRIFPGHTAAWIHAQEHLWIAFCDRGIISLESSKGTLMKNQYLRSS
jgi:erythromycin esterase-like protein